MHLSLNWTPSSSRTQSADSVQQLESRAQTPLGLERSRPARQYLTVTFVRHSEAEHRATAGTALTRRGHEAAVRLGERWKHIRLDKVYTSPSARAYATALALVEPRAGAAIRTVSSALSLNTATSTPSSSLRRSKKPQLQQQQQQQQQHQHDFPSISAVASVPVPRALPCLREQDQGAVAVPLSAHQPGSAQPLAPQPTGTLADERAFKYPGGESLDDVSQRARAFVLDTLLTHASAWPTMGMHRPKPLNPDSAPPADVPHVVVVSHNVFLTELFELLACWGKKEHVMTTYQLELMQWSRHVISFEGPASEPRNLRLHTLYTPTPIRKHRS